MKKLLTTLKKFCGAMPVTLAVIADLVTIAMAIAAWLGKGRF